MIRQCVFAAVVLQLAAMASAQAQDVLEPEEIQMFRAAVSACWNPGDTVGPAKVVVAFSLRPDGTVLNDEVRLVEAFGTDEKVQDAFQSARRAIIRCQQGGYPLPADKYEIWKEVQMTFDAAGMQLG